MKYEQLEEIVDGCALLRYNDRLYAIAGSENGKFVFADIKDDSRIRATYDEILQNKEYAVAY